MNGITLVAFNRIFSNNMSDFSCHRLFSLKGVSLSIAENSLINVDNNTALRFPKKNAKLNEGGWRHVQMCGKAALNIAMRAEDAFLLKLQKLLCEMICTAFRISFHSRTIKQCQLAEDFYGFYGASSYSIPILPKFFNTIQI